MDRDNNLLQIVVIDDDEVQEVIFGSFLQLIDIPTKAHFFKNEKDIMDYLKSLKNGDFPHLIFVDLYMPNRIGWDVISKLEESFQTQIRSSNIYLLTSSTHESETIEAINSKLVEEILIKPINEDKLRSILEKYYKVD